MITKVRDVIHHLTKKPKTLFLIDGLGAMLTSFLLFVVLRKFNEYFGMPITTLTYLSIIAACLCIYSTICYFFLKENWPLFIRIISICNILYCLLTVVLMLVYYSVLTRIGISYFLAEVVTVCGLVYIERNVATEISKR